MKVGDRVKMVRPREHPTYSQYQGQVGVVTHVRLDSRVRMLVNVTFDDGRKTSCFASRFDLVSQTTCSCGHPHED